MTDIFISYSSRDRARVMPLANALIAEGFDVWWDTSGLQSGHAWRKEIEKHLEAAKTVIVCWSAASRDSDWVIQEAEHAKRLGRLRPVSLDRGVQLPLGFREIQSLDVSAWLSGHDVAPLTHLISAIENTPGIPSKHERATRQRQALEREQERKAAEAERVRRAEEERSARRLAAEVGAQRAEEKRRARRLAAEVNARNAASNTPSRQFKLPLSGIVVALVVLAIGGWLLNQYNDRQSRSGQQQVSETLVQQPMNQPQQSPVEAEAPPPPPPIVYPRCEQPYALECVNPTIRRAVVEARANAAEAEVAEQRALAAQLVALEAARRARAGERYFRTNVGSGRSYALFEGTESYNREGRFGIIRYHANSAIERYEGQYGLRSLESDGSGVALYRSGFVYRGSFVEGVPNGMGIREEGSRRRAGLWINGEPSSYTSTNADGRRYEGTADTGVRWTPDGQIEESGYWAYAALQTPVP